MPADILARCISVQRRAILLLALVLTLGAVLGVNAQQVQPQSNAQTQALTHTSIHDVVRDIQQYEEWTILQYFDKEDDDTGVRYYRFKLQRYDGKLVIVDVDPMEPDLKQLSR